jgi:S-DNA-T family DNA segregation ATPase FtsK/SpoIIIE
MLLATFDLAGIAGQWLDQALGLLFGWTRVLVALGFFVIGIGVVRPGSRHITPWTYAGLLLLVLSGTGLINALSLGSAPVGRVSEAFLVAHGGYAGLLLEHIGRVTIGFWGTLVVLVACVAASGVLMLYESFDDMRTLWLQWQARRLEEQEEALARMSGRLRVPHGEHGKDGGKGEHSSHNHETVSADTDDTDAAEAPSKKRSLFGGKPEKEESVLTTKRQQKVELPLSLLDHRPLAPDAGNIEQNGEVIVRTLTTFGIPTEVVDVSIGPTITQYAIRPAEGVKLSRLVGLQSDLALALAAHPIRIEAPIPGKSLVGIEVPNKSIATVSLRTLLESKAFQRRETELTVALGMDVSGKAWVAGLEKMPHLLVAGATGSGKSVCLNTMIVSLLFQHGPDTLKFIMIDPKRVELPAYAGIPHLLVPPITKAEEAINALKWTVREMERRLDMLSAVGARNIASYNKKSEEQMPFIVVVMDELADLMATSSRDVEALVVRIAQMARAVGIHLILATQRPSVDVITGTIKANIPARIAFAVASQMDSRTILDSAGAEKLLGRGDMLYTCADLPKARRMQGAFVSDQEIKNVVDALKDESPPEYNYEVLERQEGGGVVFGTSDGNDDALLQEAAEVVIAEGRASTSLLQRRLKVGYSRAARIIDLLEEQGIIGPGQGAKPRDILVSSLDELGKGHTASSAAPAAVDREFVDNEEEEENAEQPTEDEGTWQRVPPTLTPRE